MHRTDLLHAAGTGRLAAPHGRAECAWAGMSCAWSVALTVQAARRPATIRINAGACNARAVSASAGAPRLVGLLAAAAARPSSDAIVLPHLSGRARTADSIRATWARSWMGHSAAQ
eukprot:354986-Chlamydomonas_euryale.AAC.2